jgi:ATP-dependent RNA helicase DDX31/DBP7
MAEDGLMINFAIGDEPLKAKHSFKGGSWRDRLKAKKSDRFRQSRRQVAQEADDVSTRQAATSTDDTAHIWNDHVSRERPAKRQRVESHSAGHSTSNSLALPSKNSSSKPREVISSLFSFNPDAKTVPEKTAKVTEPAKPTNAPLIDKLVTFTTLGVSPTLAAHLLTKLELKAPTAIQTSSISQLLKEDGDAFIQAETGSGKTLAYLLPLVQRIMNLSKEKQDISSMENGESSIHRDSGLFAIILAPTRELCKQISVVLENLLRCSHWIVAGTVIGGEKKKSEKARLRKGLNILVATPGRLADHLDNTKVLDVSNVRWLVLDEGDRLMDMGFEEEIQGIVKKLDASQRQSPNCRIPGLPEKRTTILCSATMKMNVQRLGEISLKDAVLIKPDESNPNSKPDQSPLKESSASKQESTFSAPAQLKQSYTIVPAKLRLVTLTALLRRTFNRKGSDSMTKVIIFLSCADSVDFHFEVFSRPDASTDPTESPTKSSSTTPTTTAPCTILSNPQSSNPTVSRLHGSLPQHLRTSTLEAFSRSKSHSILLSTDLASRGLDLPSVDFVIEYDPPFDIPSHIHRIGRTARVGRSGQATIFLLPGPEESYIPILQQTSSSSLFPTSYPETLKGSFGSPGLGAGKDWEERATEWQLSVERWVLDTPKYLELARRAFQSHIRAYATHVAAEREIFDIKSLHLGHLAKAFGLRDRPGNINAPGIRAGGDLVKKKFKQARGSSKGNNNKAKVDGRDGVEKNDANSSEAVTKMRAKMKMISGGGADEFNIA